MPISSITETIHNPLDLPLTSAPEASQAFRKTIGVPADALLIGNAGWLTQRKRFDVFLHSAAKILAHCPGAYFVIAGDGEMRDSLQRLAASLGIATRVFWTGWLTDLTPFYAGIDVLLFNSDWDALGLTPVEAMSYGVPVVASVEHGGLGEILDNRCGWFMERHDPRALALAVVAALSLEGKVRRRRRGGALKPNADPPRFQKKWNLGCLGK